MGLALRANLFPKVTDPVCRIPLSTLFYGLEAANLGDLLRFRYGQACSCSLKFSRAVGGAPDSTQGVLLFQVCSLLSSQRPPRQRLVKKKRELSLGPRPDVFEFICVATQHPTPACGMLTAFPFGLDSVFAGLPLASGPSYSCPSAVHMKPCSTSVFKVLI